MGFPFTQLHGYDYCAGLFDRTYEAARVGSGPFLARFDCRSAVLPATAAVVGALCDGDLSGLHSAGAGR